MNPIFGVEYSAEDSAQPAAAAAALTAARRMEESRMVDETEDTADVFAGEQWAEETTRIETGVVVVFCGRGTAGGPASCRPPEPRRSLVYPLLPRPSPPSSPQPIRRTASSRRGASLSTAASWGWPARRCGKG